MLGVGYVNLLWHSLSLPYKYLESSMLHANFDIHRTSGFREENLKVFTINGHDGHLGHVIWTICINFRSLFTRRLQLEFGFD